MAHDRVIVGALSGAFGVQGEVRLKSFCADPAAIADYVPLYTEDGRAFDQVVITGQLKNAFSARVSGIVSKEEADALRNTSLYADRSAMPPTEDDEYYYADLIGLAVYDAGGAQLGTVKTVVDHGAGDLLEVTLPGVSETRFSAIHAGGCPNRGPGRGQDHRGPARGAVPRGLITP